MIIQDKASLARRFFKLKNNRYIQSDDIFDWVVTMIRDVHNTMLPDNYKYQFIVDSLELIAESKDIEDIRLESDVHTSELLKWLSSHLMRLSYCDDAKETYGLEGHALVNVISAGQEYEKNEVLQIVLDHLKKQL